MIWCKFLLGLNQMLLGIDGYQQTDNEWLAKWCHIIHPLYIPSNTKIRLSRTISFEGLSKKVISAMICFTRQINNFKIPLPKNVYIFKKNMLFLYVHSHCNNSFKTDYIFKMVSSHTRSFN